MPILDLKEKTLRAVGDKVVVLRAGRPKKTSGGILLPDETINVYNEGVVQSVGPDVKSCKAGDSIVWQVYKGQAAGHHDEQRWIIADSEVLAVVEPEAHHNVGSKCTLPNCPHPHRPVAACGENHPSGVDCPACRQYSELPQSAEVESVPGTGKALERAFREGFPAEG